MISNIGFSKKKFGNGGRKRPEGRILTLLSLLIPHKAAEESVRVVDGIFGSNQTSRAIASIVTLVRREISHDEDFKLAKVGRIAVLTGLTKALTAFAFLQNVTHKRTMKSIRMTPFWEGIVVVEEEDERSIIEWDRTKKIGPPERRAAGELILGGTTVNGNTTSLVSDVDDTISEHPDIIRELEDILSLKDSANANQSSSDDYEIVTTTRTTTVKSTTIRPIGKAGGQAAGDTSSEWVMISPAENGTNQTPDRSKVKTIVVREDQEQVESFLAAVKPTTADASFTTSESNQEYSIPGAWVDTPSPIRGDGKVAKFVSPGKGFKIFLSTMTKRLQKRKVERTEQYDDEDHGGNGAGSSEIAEKGESGTKTPTTTMTTTSTTMMTTTAQYQEQVSRSSTPTSDEMFDALSDDDVGHAELEKKRSPWDRLRFRSKMTSAFMFGGSTSSSKPKRNGRSLLEALADHGDARPRGASKSIASLATDSSSSSISNYEDANFLAPKSSPKTSREMQRDDPSIASLKSSRGTFGRRRAHSIASIASIQSVAHTTTTTTYTTTSPDAGSSSSGNYSRAIARSPLQLEPNPRNFPRAHLVQNIGRFMRYASAAYGESFMRILGIGSMPHVLPTSYQHHSNHYAFSHHTGVPVEDILLSSYTDHSVFNINNPQIHALVHYVTVDHKAQAIVLTCRGTLGLSDVLTDLTCDYAEFVLPCDDDLKDDGEAEVAGGRRKFRAHAGMLGSAQLLAKQKGKVYRIIKDALEEWSDYGLVLCGHSLGAGVASLLSVLWSEERDVFLAREKEKVIGLTGFAEYTIPFVTSYASGLPPGRPIHCYAYGVPCTMSLELAKYCGQGLVTSIVHSYDIVPSLSLGLLKDFKNIAVSLHEEGKVTEEILTRILGKYRKSKRASAAGGEMFTNPLGSHSSDPSTSTSVTALEGDDEDDQWFWAVIKTMRADMRAEKLYPPSTLYHIEAIPQLVVHTGEQLRTPHVAAKAERTKQAHKVVFKRCDDVEARFSEIVFSRSMFSDHSPREYEKCVELLWRGVLAEDADG